MGGGALRTVQTLAQETENSMAGCLKGGIPVNVAKGGSLIAF